MKNEIGNFFQFLYSSHFESSIVWQNAYIWIYDKSGSFSFQWIYTYNKQQILKYNLLHLQLFWKTELERKGKAIT